MKLSVIWILSGDIEKNNKTYNFFKGEQIPEAEHLQIIACGSDDKREYLAGLTASEKVSTDFLSTEFSTEDAISVMKIIDSAVDLVQGDYVTVFEPGDLWSCGSLYALMDELNTRDDSRIIMLHKEMSDGNPGAFCSSIYRDDASVINLETDFSTYPFYFGGTVLKTQLFRSRRFSDAAGLESEREYFLSLCAAQMKVVYLQSCIYYSAGYREGNDTFFPDIYKAEWYDASLGEFWPEYLEELKNLYGKIPAFIQYHVMFTMHSRIESNWNNKNKHVTEDGEKVLRKIGNLLQFIDDDIIFNCHKIRECITYDSLKWVYGILKYGPSYRFRKSYLSGNAYYTGANTAFNKIENLKTNIMFMDYRDGMLEIDAQIHPILYSMASEVYFVFDGMKYLPEYNETYALTKVFGVSIYKSHSCHVRIPIISKINSVLFCKAVIEGEAIKINFSFQSHFSRISPLFCDSYWNFGKEQKYLMLKEQGGLSIRSVGPEEWKKQEKKLSREMTGSHNSRHILFYLIRKAYFAVRPILKRKPVWMYIDKIYKGGDSSEYLYKYAVSQDNDFRHYYLIDKNSSDYRRLKKEGYKPLVRGSIKHRLVFLLADMMVISNSTVFAFNDFPMLNSRYVRDLTDFHVCCVQHGMSVQKIAIAQNRLRDNTRLYFCASKYEIENLSKPVYGYEGTDALRLTGVPRYDGLADRAVKQIMISPTWRMQAAVPVADDKNEGQLRDYNPLFKESDYFRVYNTLINDERLISAAREYGYRIKYVLHPIVSSQLDDFDKNDYVDIVPAVGDMSYEDMFCESALMVTDFSGIQFDFAYMRKPVVYLHHKDIPQHYEEGTFFYDTMGFGEICHDNDELIDLLIEYMRNGCHMKEEYVRRADDFFYYDDHDNCKRVYETMVEYQEKNILNQSV